MKSGSLRRILSYTYRYKWSFVISVIGFITFAAADIAAVEWIRRIISYIDSEEKNLNTLLAMSLIFIAIGRGVGFFVGNYFMSRVGFGIVHDLRAELFQKLHDLPKSYFDANQSGQLINRITFTTTQVSGAASNAVKTLVREGFLLVGLFIYLLILNFKLTLLLIATAPLIALIVYVAGKRLKKLATKIQTAMGDVTHIASEAVDGHVEIKSFNAEEYENNRFFIANTSNKNQNLKLEATGNLATPIIQILVSISLSLVAFFALGSQLGISLDAETFVAFFTAAGLMAKPIRQLSNVNIIIQKGLAAANEIFDQLDQENEDNTGENTNTIEGNIEFKDVSFSYNTGGLIINNVSFKIAKNETVAIVGKSGSGKSTIANLIPRFYNHTSGDIKIDGISVNDYSLKHLRSSISIVNQSPSLFNDTIAKNIAYGDDEIDASRLKECAEQAGCMDFIESLPEGFESEIGDDGVLLSGGQRQRLAIARAFYKDSPIIILDEATSALDTESELIVQEALEKLITNRTTIVIAHRLSTIENASRIIVLDNGVISETGTHKELLDNDGIYQSLYKNWLYLLTPFSLIFTYLTNRRRRKFLKNKTLTYKPDVPIIVVGNLTIGGTGKTPLVAYIANELKKLGYRPGLVSRGYGGKFRETLEVKEDTPVKNTGDEAQILAKLNLPFYIDKNRVRAVKTLVENHDCNVIISDDGLQHYNIFDITRNSYPDHHNFTEEEVHFLDHLPIIMTEKDASKCRDFDNNKIWYLTIEADVSDKFIQEIDNKLKSLSS
ncbi:MAG: lipid A export permease/ATP-binding protein MsbA [Proteobacteria bacterium]|nr:lipid A export permease/ATP-binding protein MsbA [Pseudomonadota bacterium]